MPRYFFHTHDGGAYRDEDGLELADPDAARKAAIQYAGAILHDDPDVVWDGRDFRVIVTNEQARLLFTVITLPVDAREAMASS